MNPLETAGAFATIVGLVGSFLNEQRNRDAHDIEEFYLWLKDHGHNEIQEKIEANQKTAISIKALLANGIDVMLQRLEKLDSMLLMVASQIEGINEVAGALGNGPILSGQAIELLKQLEKRRASGFFELYIRGGELELNINEGGRLEYEDPRFIEDDLATLVELGFLSRESMSKGGNKYRVRRLVTKFLALNA